MCTEHGGIFRRLLCCLALTLAVGVSPIFADGMIFPSDPGEPHRMMFLPPQPQQNFTIPLSVTYHRVKVDIKETGAETHVDQAFYNHEPRTVEGMYIFPLPPGASISGFGMDIDGTMTKAELLDADKARGIYEDIVRQMRDPGLLEFMGQGMFKTRIYPIEGLKEKKVKIDYQEALKPEGNLIRYSYPLNIERFSKEPMKEVSIEVHISSKTPIGTIYSPSHNILIKKEGDNAAVVSFEAEKLRPDKDFVLYYSLSEKDMSMSFLAHRPDPTEDGTFMMMLSPRNADQDKTVPPKDVAFIFDTSGSMVGEKLSQAKKALNFCLNSMRNGDRYFLESFATEANPYKKEFTEVNDQTRAGALEYVKGIEAMGGTNISDSLEAAFKALSKREGGKDRSAFIVFLTDGAPTAGLTEPEDILKSAKEWNAQKARVFVFGVGDTVNTTLLDRLSEEHGGVSNYVSDKEDIEVKVSDLFSKLSHPAMTDVSLDIRNVETAQLYPRTIPDVFRGSHVMVLGRYKKPGNALVRLTGTIDGKPVQMDYETTFPEQEKENGFVARIWATRKIGFLLDQIRKNGVDEELKGEIVTLAKRYGILTPYTSFLVLEDKKTASGPDLRRIMAPSPSMDGESRKRFDESNAAFDVGRLKAESTGADSVDAAQEMSAMKAAAGPAPAPSSMAGGFSGKLRRAPAFNAQAPGGSSLGNEGERGSGAGGGGIQQPVSKIVAERTFYLIDGKWVDSNVKSDTPDLKVKAYTDAYFELTAKYTDVNKFLALGDRLIIRIGNKTVEISPDEGESAKGKLNL
ncbi:MAG: VWA domain-containing protein [Candidatus Riflebacteria bacterium]|nr:VWA domain-containing protein [Candidatus Riflebacteria bacterium]